MTYQILNAAGLIENRIVLDPEHAAAYAATLTDGRTLRPETPENAGDPFLQPPQPPMTAELALAAGHTVDGRTYDLSIPAQNAWANSLTVLREAQNLGAISDTTPVESVLGPVLDISGTAVPSMTVQQYRVLLLTQLMPRVAQIRAGNY